MDGVTYRQTEALLKVMRQIADELCRIAERLPSENQMDRIISALEGMERR